MNFPNASIVGHLPTLQKMAANCAVLLEIGSEYGTGSTAAFRRGMEQNTRPERLWVTVDLRDQIDLWMRPAFPFWSFVQGDSRDPATRVKVKECLGPNPPDLVFIDTEHTYAQMSAELLLWAPVVVDSCTWLFHDTHMNGQYNHMTDAIKEFAEREGRWVYEQLSTECHGLGSLKPRK